MAEFDSDAELRNAAFTFLNDRSRFNNGSFTRTDLERGFAYKGESVRLIGPQGIFKPRQTAYYPISVTTVAPKAGQPRPYDDGFSDDGSVLYRYRGTDPGHHENVRLKHAAQERVPLVYFHGTIPGVYAAFWPVYVVNYDDARLTFTLDLVESVGEFGVAPMEAELERRYARVTTRRRLHQQTFRDRVLSAYRSQCAICRLKHAELLDAAHIIEDSNERGEPRVSNGLSLCKLHHAAYDRNLFGVRPDFSVDVLASILEETDGPMLRHGLQGIHRSSIYVPAAKAQKPDPDALEERYERFLASG